MLSSDARRVVALILADMLAPSKEGTRIMQRGNTPVRLDSTRTVSCERSFLHRSPPASGFHPERIRRFRDACSTIAKFFIY